MRQQRENEVAYALRSIGVGAQITRKSLRDLNQTSLTLTCRAPLSFHAQSLSFGRHPCGLGSKCLYWLPAR
jgi:hypothetical protein